MLSDIEEIYEKYFSVVYKYILSISGDALVAEEITQETFFKAINSNGEYRGEASVKTWLCRIAKNSWIDYIRKQSKTASIPEGYDIPGPSVEKIYMDGAAAKEIHKILHGLSEPYKEVFALRALGELSFADIGELFGKSDSWARVTYHRARMKIREELIDGKDNM